MGTLFSDHFPDLASNLPRIFVPPDCWQQTTVDCPEQEVRHLTKVFRIRTGDQACLFDGAGRMGAARVSHLSRAEIQMELISTVDIPPPPNRYGLAFGLLKNQHTEQVIQQAVELGVNLFIPLVTAHTISRPNEIAKKLDRWNKIIQAAVCQSGRAWAPECREPTCIEDVCKMIQDPSSCWMLTDLTAKTPLLSACKSQGTSLTGVMVGPEGDFTPEEKSTLLQAGAQRVSLGPYTLRSETAALAAVAVMMAGACA